MKLAKNKTYIKCKWQEEGRILVNPDGQVWPCCYLCNIAFMAEQKGGFGAFNKVEPSDKWGGNLMQIDGKIVTPMMEYKKNYSELNLKNRSMEEILKHEWYTKTLPESWENEEDRIPQCREFCEHSVED